MSRHAVDERDGYTDLEKYRNPLAPAVG